MFMLTGELTRINYVFVVGYAKIVRTLTGVESDINLRDEIDTSLHYASKYGNF